MKREPLSRGEKVLAIASVVVVSTILGGGLWLERINAEPKLDFPPVAKRPSTNGFDVYLRAGQTIRDWAPTVDAASDTEIVTDAKIREQRYGLARRQAWLKSNAGGFALFEKALTLPCLHPDVRRQSLGQLPDYRDFRSLARQITARTNTLKLRGDWNGAAHSGLDSIQMGIDIARGGPIMSKHVGAACAAIGRASLENVPNRLNSRETTAAARRLEGLIARRVSYSEALEEEKWAASGQFLLRTRTTAWRDFVTPRQSLPLWLRLKTVSKTEVVFALIQRIQQAKNELEKPYSSLLPPPETNFGAIDLFMEDDYRATRLGYNQAREVTGLNSLLLRFALRAYEAEQGKFPQTLDELAPKYLKAIPRDVFADGKPFHYRLEGKAYRLWSVGPDMKNDNGTPIPREHPLAKDQPWRPIPIRNDSKGDWIAGQHA
ncbi:MAG TPA: hypothetical protein VF681_02965 [Abditibacteriaceae bacterium]|jgi:hypothetical protein